MEPDDELVRIDDVKCIHATKDQKGRTMAIKCVHEDWDDEKWIPFSLVHADSDVYAKDTEGTLVIPRWFAKKNVLV